MEEVRVLDHGYVRLVDHMGSDLSVVRAARVSYDADWRVGEDHGSDIRLIRYLMKNHHTSPFEAVTLTFEVKAPIFVIRQWHRHRTWSYNEVSARYAEIDSEFYVPLATEVGSQSKTNRQGRDLDVPERYRDIVLYEDLCKQAHQLYNGFLALGWPRELARGVLPLSTYTRMFATVNLLNLTRFLTLRTDDHAQLEIRRYAEACRDLAYKVAPHSMAAWEEL